MKVGGIMSELFWWRAQGVAYLFRLNGRTLQVRSAAAQVVPATPADASVMLYCVLPELLRFGVMRRNPHRVHSPLKAS